MRLTGTLAESTRFLVVFLKFLFSTEVKKMLRLYVKIDDLLLEVETYQPFFDELRLKYFFP